MADFRAKLKQKNASSKKVRATEMLSNIESNRLVNEEEDMDDIKTTTGLVKEKSDQVTDNVTVIIDTPKVMDDIQDISDNQSMQQKKNLSSKITSAEKDISSATENYSLEENESLKKEITPSETEQSSRLLDVNYRVSIKNIKKTTYTFTENVNNYINRRSLQLHMPLLHYLNMLIEEDVACIGDEDYIEPDHEIKDILDNEKMKVSRLISLSEEHMEHLIDAGAIHLMKPSKYFNYIIIREMKREEREGERKWTKKK